MSTILLVDSNAQALDELAVSLKGMPTNWTIHLARSGAEALRVLATLVVDVIVSDSQLADMSGLELFGSIRQADPLLIRFTYSTDCSLEVVMEGARANNRFITKSDSHLNLAMQITNSLRLRTILKDKELCGYMEEIKTIPALPVIYDEMVKELASAHSSLIRVANIVESDVGLSVTVLKIVNSAFYGLSRRVESVSQGVTLLGAHLIKNITLTAKVFARFEGSTLSVKRLTELNKEAIRIGAIANQFARHAKLSRTTTDHCQIAGMMANVGQLIATVKKVNNNDSERVATELLGASLLQKWKMPDAVIEAIALQYESEQQRADEVTPLAVLHSIRYLQENYLDATNQQQHKQCKEYLTGFLSADTVDHWLDAFQAIEQLTEADSKHAA